MYHFLERLERHAIPCSFKFHLDIGNISHKEEKAVINVHQVGLVSIIILLYIESLNCLIKDNIYLSSSPSPSTHKGNRQIHSLAGKICFPFDKLL